MKIFCGKMQNWKHLWSSWKKKFVNFNEWRSKLQHSPETQTSCQHHLTAAENKHKNLLLCGHVFEKRTRQKKTSNWITLCPEELGQFWSITFKAINEMEKCKITQKVGICEIALRVMTDIDQLMFVNYDSFHHITMSKL